MGRPASRKVDFGPYIEFRICREMGWTYEELARQPSHRVEEIMAFLEAESEARKAMEGVR